MSGAGMTATAAVVNGQLVPRSMHRERLAGSKITWYWRALIDANHPELQSTGESVYESNKEEHCYVALDYAEELKKDPGSLRVTLTCGGQTVVDADQQRFMAPEIMFQPELVDEPRSVQDLAKSALDAAPTSTLDELLQNVVLAGGNTLMKGFPERLKKELSRITGRDVTIHAPSNRRFLAWNEAKRLAQNL